MLLIEEDSKTQMVSIPRDFVSHWHLPEYRAVAAEHLSSVDVCWMISVSPTVVAYFWMILSCLCTVATPFLLFEDFIHIPHIPWQLERATIINNKIGAMGTNNDGDNVRDAMRFLDNVQVKLSTLSRQ